MARSKVTVRRITDAETRELAFEVLNRVYLGEKGWVETPQQIFKEGDLENDAVVWFLAEREGRPVGLVRVLFEIPFELYHEYGFQTVDEDLDVEAFVRDNRIAEIGRFAVVPDERKNIMIAAVLMREAATVTIERGFTHFITDVFEADPNNPFDFHERILGFRTVATHDVGELKIRSKRITMLVDIREAYERWRGGRRNWMLSFIMRGWGERFSKQLS
ncbi:MAG: GNAT family N-acetyltransferase [Acidobacteriota bacterium]